MRGRPFPKGVSGNPAGRPRSGEAVAEYIRQLAGPDGRAYIDRLHDLAVGPHDNVRARLTAIGLLLERGYGKPPQAVDLQAGVVQLDPEALKGLTTEELQWAVRIFRRLNDQGSS